MMHGKQGLVNYSVYTSNLLGKFVSSCWINSWINQLIVCFVVLESAFFLVFWQCVGMISSWQVTAFGWYWATLQSWANKYVSSWACLFVPCLCPINLQWPRFPFGAFTFIYTNQIPFEIDQNPQCLPTRLTTAACWISERAFSPHLGFSPSVCGEKSVLTNCVAWSCV